MQIFESRRHFIKTASFIRLKEATMYKTILLPLDGSKRAQTILPQVVNLAACYNAEVILLRVEEPELLLGFDEVVDVTNYRKEREQQRKEIESYLASVQQDLRKKDIKTKMLIGQGPVVSTIINTAEKENADLIAMASHGLGGSSRTFYGSVAAGMLQRIDRPLLIVRSRRVE
jgi:nucleotide-binding universal stress UspA family protein